MYAWTVKHGAVEICPCPSIKYVILSSSRRKKTSSIELEKKEDRVNLSYNTHL
jgi:hypothetical protein